MIAEQASALGHSNRAADAALVKLTEREGQGTEAEIEMLVDDAAECEWALFIQREACGMSNGRDVIKQYYIPGKILAPGGRPASW